jgi:hypothetical protein
MTGNPDEIIVPVNYIVTYLLAFLVFCVLLLIEGLAGYGIFEFSGSSYSAIAWSLITVTVLALTSYFGGTNRAIVTANDEAKNTYKIKCPNGFFDARGVGVEVAPVEKRVRVITAWLELTGVLWSLGLVAFRTTMAVTHKELGWNAVFGSVAMVVLAGVYYLLETRYAPKFPHADQKEYQLLAKELRDIDARITELSAPDPNDPYPVEREKLVLEYNAEADRAAEEVTSRCEKAKHQAATYCALVGQYNLAHQMLRQAYRHLQLAAAIEISAHQAEVNVGEIQSAEKQHEMEEIFISQIVLVLEDDNLEAWARQFHPAVNLPPDIRVTDFDAVEDSILNEVGTGTKRDVSNV